LRNLEIAGGKEVEQDDDDDDDERNDDRSEDYLNKLMAVADARYELGEYDKAGTIYFTGHITLQCTSLISSIVLLYTLLRIK
jgi:hypothetical protein